MKILIVGAGFSGAVIAREMAEAGHIVTVIEKRDHIGGNAYDKTNKRNIWYHPYGPHLFHTDNEKVWNYLSQFTEWIDYKHKVKAQLSNGQFVTLPVNKETAEIVGPENVVETFIRPYSEKMWNLPLEQLDPNILSRVPIRDDMNEYYFPNDKYQAMPKDGYTELFRKMFTHPNITVVLKTAFSKEMIGEYDHVFNSMPIDVYYDFIYGELPYRSIKFHHVELPMTKILPAPVVNFTNNGTFTRITEWNQIPSKPPYILEDGDDLLETLNENGVFPEHRRTWVTPWTLLTYEEPCDYRNNNRERFYPVKDLDGKNRELYKKYAEIENEKVTFIGRLGLYAYLDMHQAVSSALAIAEKHKKLWKEEVS